MQTLTCRAALGIREVSGLTGLSMLRRQSGAIEQQMEQLRADLGVIQDKIEHYQDLIDRGLDCEDEITARTGG
jgi:hypothetical protein